MLAPANVGFIPSKDKVTTSAFIAVLWTGPILALCLLLFRLFVRIKSFRKIYADDYLVIVAWLILFANAIAWQIQYKVVFELYHTESTGVPPGPGFLIQLTKFLKFNAAGTILFYTCLYTVKISYLIFFRRLGSKIGGFRVWWWIVVVLCIVTWITCIGVFPYDCSTGGIAQLLATCAQQNRVSYQAFTLYYACAVDIVTDILIITIPVLLLWNVKIGIRQKLALLGIFSLTIMTIIFAVIRVAVVAAPHMNADIIWLALWGNIEIAISVMVACLGSFRQLFVHQTHSNQHPHFALSEPTKTENLSFWRRGFFSSSKTNKSNMNTFNSQKSKTKQNNQSDVPNSSSEHIITLPLTSVHISGIPNLASKSFENVVSTPFPTVISPYLSAGDGCIWETRCRISKDE